MTKSVREHLLAFCVVAAGFTTLIRSGNAQSHLKPTFAGPIRVAKSHDRVSAMVAGDFNEDGATDLVAVGWEQVSVFVGNGDGTFEVASALSGPRGSVFTADFNGDRHADLVFGDSWLLLGNGDGTFISQRLEMLVEAIGDFNGDDKQDLFGRTTTVHKQIGAWLNDGNGSFIPAATSEDTNLNYPGSTLAGDLNTDGIPDILRLGIGNPSSILFANGDGTFRTGPSAQIGHTGLTAAAMGYFNPGTKSDLAIIDFEYPSPYIGIFLGQSDGTFSWLERHTVPSAFETIISSIIVADLTVDGRSDLLVPVPATAQFALFQGKGDGTFEPGVLIGRGVQPVAVGDFDGDARNDLAFVRPVRCPISIEVYLNTTGDPTPPQQGLAIKAGNRTVDLFWPSAMEGFRLESITNLTQTNWESLVQIASLTQGSWQQPIRKDQEFFRLRKSALAPQVHGPVTLTNSDFASLQAAIHGVVTLSFDGSVKLTNALVIEADTTLDATGRQVVLDGSALTRHFFVQPGVTLRLINLTLRNGYEAGPEVEENQDGQPGYGGSIYNSGGNIELIGCKFLNNEVLGGRGGTPVLCNGFPGSSDIKGGPGFGGAIYSTNGTVLANDCVFANGKCVGADGTPPHPNVDATSGGGDAFGGAIYAHKGRLILTRVTFTDNAVHGGRMLGGRAHSGLGRGGGSASGGALAVDSVNVSISNCVFVANQAFAQTAWGQQDGSGNGGAIFLGSGSMEIDMSTFRSNAVTGGTGLGSPILLPGYGPGRGGAVYQASDQLVVRNCTFASNQAIGGKWSPREPQRTSGLGLGGAIYSLGPLSLTNCTFAQNAAASGVGFPGLVGFGGGIYCATNALMVNVTIADNFVQITDAEPRGSSLAGNATLLNCILACAPSQSNVSGLIIDGGHNLCSDASAAFSAATSRSHVDPLLGTLADNGGPTLTIAPMPGSPAIDAGDDSACPPTDQRGVMRPYGSASDIGAVEFDGESLRGLKGVSPHY